MRSHRPDSGMTLRELLVVIALIGGLAAIARPRVFSSHDRARTATCDNVYVALNGEVANELDVVAHGGSTACGTKGDARAVVECTLGTHRDEDNPRNRRLTAYTHADEVTANASSCRVGLVAIGTNAVRFNQYVQQASTTSRTFSVTIER